MQIGHAFNIMMTTDTCIHVPPTTNYSTAKDGGASADARRR